MNGDVIDFFIYGTAPDHIQYNRHSCALYKGLGGVSVQSGQKQTSSKFLGLFRICRMSVLSKLNVCLHYILSNLLSPLFPVVFPLSFGTVHATDLDGDLVTYSLLHNLTIFTVSPAGGEVAALEEVRRTYTLTVVAVDSGTPP